jgi:hypothetical protein
MPAANLEINLPKLLLVEGNEEVYFFTALQQHLRIGNVQIFPFNGKDNLNPFLKTLIALPRFHEVTTVGIIRDADSSKKSTMQSVQNALRRANLPVPKTPLQLTGSKPRVAFLILPHGRNSGMLEDVCLDSEKNNSLMQCVETYMQCITDKKAGPRITMLSKAKVRVFLASKEEPNLLLGQAAQKGYWNWDDVSFEPLRKFISLISH